MNNKPEIEPKGITPLKHICMTIGELPSSYLETMTYYEMLLWFTKFLQERMIPALDNNALAVKELQDLFIELQKYVNNYFDNLDVQEEINNKLDEMAESGQLEEIISSYLNTKALLTFNTVNDMKSSTNLVDGSFAKTLGYYEIEDGGAGIYKITDTADSTVHQETLDSGLYATIINNNKVNIKSWGAKGDGTTDDTAIIQAAVDYGFDNDLDIYIPATEYFYKTTLPIQLYCKRDNQIGYWDGNGSRLIGENISKSRIVKIGNLTDNNGNNATIVAKNQTSALEQATGISIENLSIENYDDTSYNKTSGLAIWTNISRSTFKNLNIISFNGINATIFSSLFENIVFKCIEDALHLTNGTSNTLRFLYAPQCVNPYYISSSYSELNTVCGDDCKGSLFKIAGMGLSLNSCGCESRNLQYVFEILNDYTTLSIRDFYMIRQIGDSSNNLNIEDCAVLYSTRPCIINIDTFSIVEFNAIASGNSYFFKTTQNTSISTFLKNLRYYKNFIGAENPKLKLWNTNPNIQSPQRFTSQSQDYSYIISDGNAHNIVPFIGNYQSSNMTDVQGNILNSDDLPHNKTIWLDNKTKYTTESNQSNRFLGRHQVGDLQLYNDPLTMNAMGLSITSVENNYTWDALEIPIVLRGATADRPTANLFIGLQYFDTTLGKPIWYNGTNWVDATGTQV